MFLPTNLLTVKVNYHFPNTEYIKINLFRVYYLKTHTHSNRPSALPVDYMVGKSLNMMFNKTRLVFYKAASHAQSAKMRPIVTDVPWSVCVNRRQLKGPLA